MLRNIDLALLVTFLDIVKTQSFAASANNLNLTPAAVSARVKILEETLSKPLFSRNKHQVQITEYGKQLIPYAKSMLETWQQVSSHFSVNSEKPTISIAAPESLLTSKLEDIAIQLHNHFQNHHIKVQSQDSKVNFLELLEYKVDFGFMFDNFQHDSIVVEPLFEIELQLYSTTPNTTIQDINNSNYIYVDWDKDFSKLHKKFIPQVNHPKFSASNWQMAINFLMEFGGVSLLPKSFKTDHLYIVKNASSIHRTIYCGYHKSSAVKNSHKSLLALIKSLYSSL